MIQIGHLDINIVTHCNNRCAACSHASPFTKPYYMAIETLKRDLEVASGFLRCKKIHIVGGEPTLHPQVVNMVAACRASLICDSVVFITNGRLLPKMGDEFWGVLDELSLSIYDNLDKSVIDLCRTKQDKCGFGFHSTRFDEFYQQFKVKPDDGVEAFNNCHWKSDCFTLHEGHFYLCPQSAFFTPKFLGLPAETDGINIHTATEQQVLEFMNRKQPFNACKICSGGFSKKIAWKESKNITEWIKESTE